MRCTKPTPLLQALSRTQHSGSGCLSSLPMSSILASSSGYACAGSGCGVEVVVVWQKSYHVLWQLSYPVMWQLSYPVIWQLLYGSSHILLYGSTRVAVVSCRMVVVRSCGMADAEQSRTLLSLQTHVTRSWGSDSPSIAMSWMEGLHLQYFRTSHDNQCRH